MAGWTRPPRGVVFLPSRSSDALDALVIRADRNVSALTAGATRIVRNIAPTALIVNVLTVRQIKDQSVSPRRLNAALISSFGILAVIIASVGIAGVLAFSVSARTNEIGIRVSLGAAANRSSDYHALVARDCLARLCRPHPEGGVARRPRPCS